ncbi:hypothetical protein M409DRAFT_20949 [Zasmidium cellare ATCC 36951]|uniref:C2H2-type domain-containing protein n=1 Tax=Zasmidium cellare ATCC 36951 TaxID=1080233 RepID=A0A6A6CPA4_ZASCE|nr:uncharacterized protein M409DRAFT_20949 [Zasmidium cellare ATCC 36951]KAF2168935.1 hypothetical protein M409DRAFT_20949 [Zasmidium cellare ATCC 36951]
MSSPPRSPKRNGLILEEQQFVYDDENWPLRNQMPSLTMSPTCSEESLMPATPPNEPNESILLPGFHFSTTDENVDPAEFHRIAAQLLSGESSIKRDSGIAEEYTPPVLERHLHCDLGKDPSGRYCCSCGKSYSTSFRLREHVQACAGTSKFPCPTCDKVFETKEKRERHVQQRHNDNKEACPECGEEFPANYLPKHLASGLGGCDGMIQASMAPAPEIDEAYRDSATQSSSQQYWIYEGDLSWNLKTTASRDSKVDDEVEDQVVEQTMSYVKKLLRRPISSPATESCDLCGESFPSDDDSLAQHIGSHSMDFNEKRHRCDDCRIYFANEKDLERHLQSANLNHHCGFTFRHNSPSSSCTGHHPPTYFKSSLANDHNLMQKHLWAWELCQLRAHRVTVARLLAERLTSPQQQMSLSDCRRTYLSLLPHISVASSSSRRDSSIRTSYSSVCSDDVAEMIDTHFSRIISETADSFSLSNINEEEEDGNVSARPDSSVLSNTTKRMSKRKSLVELATKRAAQHRRNRSNPIEYLKSQAVKEVGRPQSLPMPPMGVGVGMAALPVAGRLVAA